jgi:hypothetical protein
LIGGDARPIPGWNDAGNGGPMTAGRKTVALSTAGLMMASCAGSIQVTREQAERIADAFVEARQPDFRSAMTRTSVDDGRYWMIIYRLNPDWMGGSPTIWVRKNDGRIARAASGQ